MRKVGYTLGALLLLLIALAPAFAQQPFADVPLDHWAYNSVNRLAEVGLLEGYPDGTFKGKQSLTRYEFAQAIARMLDRVEQMAGAPGPQGPPGPPGPVTPAAGGLTPEQQALLDRLAQEFAPELKALRSDLDSLTKRVEDLEAAAPPAGPAITVSGDISWRAGVYGTELGFDDVESTGYPYWEGLEEQNGMISGGQWASGTAAYGGINLPYWVITGPDTGFWADDPTQGWQGPVYWSSIPITDALKDAYKAGDFMTMRSHVSFSGQLSDSTEVNVTLLASPESNDAGSPLMDYMSMSPLWMSGNGVMDTVSINEAWLKHKTRVLLPAVITVGKQYVARGQGLLADNDQEATKGILIDWNTGKAVSWGLYWAMLDREQFYGTTSSYPGMPSYAPLPSWASSQPTTDGQDNYNLYYLDWAVAKDWNLGVNWLESGFNEEQGWSASLCGKVYGLDFYGEYAQLTQWPTGKDWDDYVNTDVVDPFEAELSESDTAWMAGLKWTSPAFVLTGEYGEVDAGYAFAYSGGGWTPYHWMMGLSAGAQVGYLNLPLSALNPNAAVDPHDINWVDRPLFLDPTNIARGWHVNVTFPKLLGERTPLSISYMDGDAYEPRYLAYLQLGGAGNPYGIAEPSKWADADSVWVVKLSRQLSECVSANLLYGRREVENVMSRQLVPVDTDGATAIYAEDDPIQVIRAELCVMF